MAIPDYQSIMLPLLQFAGDEKEHSLREAIEPLAERLSLSEEETKDLLPSGRQAIFDNRVGWALASAASLLPEADLPMSKLDRALFWLSTRLEKHLP